MIIRRPCMTYRRPSTTSRHAEAIGERDTRLKTGGAKRIGRKQAAEITYVNALRQSTSCELSAAMPNPLRAGPKMMPKLVVVCSKALAEVYCDGITNEGTAAVSAGPNTAVATACSVTRTYKVETLKLSTDIQQGRKPKTTARTRSDVINSAFLGRRSTATPIKGARTIEGAVCRIPMMLVFSGDPVTEYTNHRSASLEMPSPTCETSWPHQT